MEIISNNKAGGFYGTIEPRAQDLGLDAAAMFQHAARFLIDGGCSQREAVEILDGPRGRHMAQDINDWDRDSADAIMDHIGD